MQRSESKYSRNFGLIFRKTMRFGMIFIRNLILTLLVLSPIFAYIGIGYLYQATLPMDKTPYVHWCGLDPHSEVYIVWETTDLEGSFIQYGTDPTQLSLQISNSTPVSFHQLRLEGLTPDMRYYYQAGAPENSPSHLSVIQSFKTAPFSSSEFNFTITSDMQQLMGIGYYNTLARAIKNHGDTAFFSIAGDLIDTNDNQVNWNQFFHESVFTDQIPLVPAPGNHEGIDDQGSLYLKYFGITANGRDVFYSFNWSNTQFVICQIGSRGHVDPKNPRNIPAYTWLNETLAKGQDKAYRIIIYHINNMEVMAPIIEKYNVSLALFGHVHQYTRRYYLNHTYICLGNGGTIQGTMIEKEPYVQARTNGAGFTQIKVNATGIKIETYTPTYDLMDSVFLQRQEAGNPYLIPDKIVR